MMSDNERRADAWNNALHAEGTRVVFQRRADALREYTFLRDFVGFGVPVCVAYLATAEVFEPLKPYKGLGLGLLGLLAVIQTLLVLWSLLSKWDEELANCIRSVRESYMLKENWRKIGKGDVEDLALEYKIVERYQTIADSLDIMKSITPKEKRIGMRAGLIEFQRACCVCNQLPKTASPPIWRKQPCDNCGGN